MTIYKSLVQEELMQCYLSCFLASLLIKVSNDGDKVLESKENGWAIPIMPV